MPLLLTFKPKSHDTSLLSMTTCTIHYNAVQYSMTSKSEKTDVPFFKLFFSFVTISMAAAILYALHTSFIPLYGLLNLTTEQTSITNNIPLHSQDKDNDDPYLMAQISSVSKFIYKYNCYIKLYKN